jgi:transposase-like protein
VASRDEALSFERHRHAIRLCVLFALSNHGDEELLAERDVDPSYETARRLVLKFGLSTAANISRTRLRPCDS